MEGLLSLFLFAVLFFVGLPFCSKKCLDQFDADPGRYVRQDSITGVSS
jgi:hypothetical protein